ncbi:hypothetical protein Hdeb2414_s0016g00497981 [Helianthus debilis subsp. tardiflorus]
MLDFPTFATSSHLSKKKYVHYVNGGKMADVDYSKLEIHEYSKEQGRSYIFGDPKRTMK